MNQKQNTTINFINVFNDLLINPLISLTNKNED